MQPQRSPFTGRKVPVYGMRGPHLQDERSPFTGRSGPDAPRGPNQPFPESQSRFQPETVPKVPIYGMKGPHLQDEGCETSGRKGPHLQDKTRETGRHARVAGPESTRASPGPDRLTGEHGCGRGGTALAYMEAPARVLDRSPLGMLIAGNNVEVKKHVGAIHVKGALLLLQRKAANALLLNAYEELPDDSVKEHTVRVSDLAAAIGYDSNDHETLKRTLEALVDLKVTWNLLDPAGQREWGVGSFLASARIKAGVCRYAYPAPLRELLYNPQIYARVNLAVQTRFSSGPALALYENCLRFLKVGTTGWIGLDDWRGLLGVGDGQYSEYKRFRSKVLVPSVGQVNTHSDIRIAMETRREKRAVVALRFSVERASDASPLGELAAVLDGGGDAAAPESAVALDVGASVRMRLGEYGLTEAQAADLTAEFAADRVERNLDFVEARLASGDAVKNLAAYTVAAVRGDYERGDRAANRKRGDAKRAAAEKAAAAQQALFPAPASRVASAALGTAEERAAEAEDRRLDAAFAALADAERFVIDRGAVERLQQAGSGWWREVETAVVSGETAGLGIAVRSVLQVARRDVMRERASV